MSLKTYADRTGHTIGCVNRTRDILAVSGDLAGLTGLQQETAALDALESGDIDCYCDQYRTDVAETKPAPALARVNIGDLEPGDIVHTYGMEVIVPDDGMRNYGTPDAPVWAARCLVLNTDEVRANGIVPWSWLTDRGPEAAWVLQGNALRFVTVERRA